ncbi:hypothetical protein M426DRAFT_212553 [Hypoxylon sp. CI-4A]|nr:hypothetical protein M426DRAFT_212553 [Hypoxylon sp. CI-4A]
MHTTATYLTLPVRLRYHLYPCSEQRSERERVDTKPDSPFSILNFRINRGYAYSGNSHAWDGSANTRIAYVPRTNGTVVPWGILEPSPISNSSSLPVTEREQSRANPAMRSFQSSRSSPGVDPSFTSPLFFPLAPYY